MTRRTIVSLAAAVVIGIGSIATVSTDAFAYRGGRAGVGRVGVHHGGVSRGAAVRRAELRRLRLGEHGHHRYAGDVQPIRRQARHSGFNASLRTSLP